MSSWMALTTPFFSTYVGVTHTQCTTIFSSRSLRIVVVVACLSKGKFQAVEMPPPPFPSLLTAAGVRNGRRDAVRDSCMECMAF